MYVFTFSFASATVVMPSGEEGSGGSAYIFYYSLHSSHTHSRNHSQIKRKGTLSISPRTTVRIPACHPHHESLWLWHCLDATHADTPNYIVPLTLTPGGSLVDTWSIPLSTAPRPSSPRLNVTVSVGLELQADINPAPSFTLLRSVMSFFVGGVGRRSPEDSEIGLPGRFTELPPRLPPLPIPSTLASWRAFTQQVDSLDASFILRSVPAVAAAHFAALSSPLTPRLLRKWILSQPADEEGTRRFAYRFALVSPGVEKRLREALMAEDQAVARGVYVWTQTSLLRMRNRAEIAQFCSISVLSLNTLQEAIRIAASVTLPFLLENIVCVAAAICSACPNATADEFFPLFTAVYVSAKVVDLVMYLSLVDAVLLGVEGAMTSEMEYYYTCLKASVSFVLERSSHEEKSLLVPTPQCPSRAVLLDSLPSPIAPHVVTQEVYMCCYAVTTDLCGQLLPSIKGSEAIQKIENPHVRKIVAMCTIACSPYRTTYHPFLGYMAQTVYDYAQGDRLRTFQAVISLMSSGLSACFFSESQECKDAHSHALKKVLQDHHLDTVRNVDVTPYAFEWLSNMFVGAMTGPLVLLLWDILLINVPQCPAVPYLMVAGVIKYVTEEAEAEGREIVEVPKYFTKDLCSISQRWDPTAFSSCVRNVVKEGLGQPSLSSGCCCCSGGHHNAFRLFNIDRIYALWFTKVVHGCSPETVLSRTESPRNDMPSLAKWVWSTYKKKGKANEGVTRWDFLSRLNGVVYQEECTIGGMLWNRWAEEILLSSQASSVEQFRECLRLRAEAVFVTNHAHAWTVESFLDMCDGAIYVSGHGVLTPAWMTTPQLGHKSASPPIPELCLEQATADDDTPNEENGTTLSLLSPTSSVEYRVRYVLPGAPPGAETQLVLQFYLVCRGVISEVIRPAYASYHPLAVTTGSHSKEAIRFTVPQPETLPLDARGDMALLRIQVRTSTRHSEVVCATLRGWLGTDLIGETDFIALPVGVPPRGCLPQPQTTTAYDLIGGTGWVTLAVVS